MPAINFENDHKSLEVLAGTNLREAALKSGVHLYRPLSRVFHVNLRLGPLNFPCGSDVIEVLDGKGVNPRTADEEEIISGRWLVKRKVAPTHRLACQVVVNGDVIVRTLPRREIDSEETKARVGYVGIVFSFVLLMGIIFALIGLDLVKKI